MITATGRLLQVPGATQMRKAPDACDVRLDSGHLLGTRILFCFFDFPENSPTPGPCPECWQAESHTRTPQLLLTPFTTHNNDMSFSVVRAPLQTTHGYSRLRVPVEFAPPEESGFSPNLPFKIPYFVQDTEYVLAKDLAALWNYPSSYQVVARMVKQSGISKKTFLKSSDDHLNALLLEHALISKKDRETRLFFLPLQFVYLVVQNKECLVGDPHAATTETRKRPILQLDEDLITVSQVFPQYGYVDETTSLNHATFLSLNPITRLQVYKHEGNYRRVYGTSLSATERELICRANNFSLYDTSKPADTEEKRSSKKPLGRNKRLVGSVDPNQLDVTENMLPGCGLIPEFNVSAICKVPNYFVTNGLMSSAQQNALFNPQKAHLSSLQYKFTENAKMSKQLQQLLLNNDQEAYHSKYYYFKSYRGPGSGNYKDAAMVNRINKIRVFTPESTPKSNTVTHLPPHKVIKPSKNRFDRPIKGLVHDFYSDDNVEIVLDRQRKFTEDFTNLEMLHNNVLFNLLVNSYREVATDTWKNFYRFKSIDFEKLHLAHQAQIKSKRRNELLAKQAALQQKLSVPIHPSAELSELLRPDLTIRFTLPSAHPEFMERLPVELRGDDSDIVTSLSKPIRYVATYPDKTMPEILNQIEVVKLPNANSLGWDNLKKYRRD